MAQLIGYMWLLPTGKLKLKIFWNYLFVIFYDPYLLLSMVHNLLPYTNKYSNFLSTEYLLKFNHIIAIYIMHTKLILYILHYLQEDLLIHGDSVFDILDKQDHAAVQAELLRTPQDQTEDDRLFLCRMNVSRNARRQMRFGDQKVCLLIHGCCSNIFKLIITL